MSEQTFKKGNRCPCGAEILEAPGIGCFCSRTGHDGPCVDANTPVGMAGWETPAPETTEPRHPHRRCWKCEVLQTNDPAVGGNDKCYHCGFCGWRECEDTPHERYAVELDALTAENTRLREQEAKAWEENRRASDLAIDRLTAANTRLRAALEGLLDRYVGLVESGDAGSWDAEQELEVRAARAALEETP